MDNESKSMFMWRKQGRSVPGKASSSPKRDVSKDVQSKSRRNGQAPAASYQDFQESVNDAWDLGDDEFCVISDVKISKRMAQSTAMSVIRNHQNRSLDLSEPLSRESCSSNNPDARSVRQFPGHAQLLVASSVRKTAEDQQSGRLEKFQAILDGANANLEELRLQSWHGIPPTLRAVTWRLLCGYVPTSAEKRESTLKRKREEYWNFVVQYYGTRHDDSHQETFRQIHIDIPRMSPLIALFQQTIVQEIFERILYIWAIRHPASGYVQGINDLVTPFFIVFLQELVAEDVNLDNYDVSSLATEDLHNVEADSFWCLSKLLDGIQNNYTFAQPGIQNKVRQLKELVQRVDAGLHQHLISHEVDYLQFSFRWMNNLLMRELPLHCTIRLWDTCLAETHGFASFHLYICAAFLLHWRSYLLREKDFQGLMMLLQNLPTQSWDDEQIGQLVAEAYKMHYLFSSAPNHLQATVK